MAVVHYAKKERSMKLRKTRWKKLVSAVVAASMIVTMAPIDVSASSANASSAVRKAAARDAGQSIEDVLEQADATDTLGTGITYYYFAQGIEGIVDAGTLYIKGQEGTETLTKTMMRSWKNTTSPIRVLKLKNIKEVSSEGSGEGLFADNKDIRGTLAKLEMEGVTKLSGYAFAYCSVLETADLGDALTTLTGYGAFSGCSSLTHISIPAGVADLPADLFKNCTNLSDVALRTTAGNASIANYNNLGGQGHPFIGCSNLTIYVAAEGNAMSNAITDFYKEDCPSYWQNTVLPVSYKMSTLDKYDAKSVPSGEMEVSCGDLRMDKLPPEPELVSNTTGIASDKVEWLYYDADKKSVTGVEEFGTWYVRAKLSDETHFSIMSDYVPFTVTPMFDCDVQDGVLTITPADGVESCAIPDFKNDNDMKARAPWAEEKFSSVVVGDGITAIGDYAFYRYTLDSFTVGKDVEKIGKYAFSNASLGGMDLSGAAGLKEIGQDAFYYAAVDKMDLSGATGLTEIGSNAFYRAENLEILDLSKTAVTSIGSYAFNYCSGLETVKLPSTLETIDSSAFANASSLRIVLGLEKTKLTEVPRGLFNGCSSLEHISLPEGVKSIESTAFSNARALASISIPGSELEIANKNAFQNVSATIYVKDSTIQSALRETLSSYAAYSGDADKAEAEQKIRLIDDGTMKKTAYLEISMEKTDLDDDAIKNGAVFEPKVQEKIGAESADVKYYYYKKSGSAYVLVDEQNPEAVPAEVGVYYIQAHMEESADYYACTSNRIRCYVNGLYESPDEDYDYDSKTGVLVIKKDGTSAPWTDRFSNYREKVKEVRWAEGGTFTNSPSFSSYDALEKVVNLPELTNTDVFAHCSSLKEVTVADGVTKIPQNCFYYCKSLSNISMPDTVAEIGTQAFASSGIKEITIPDGVTKIEERTFQRSALTKIEIPDSVTKINSYAFSDCESLASLSFGENSVLASIGPSAFNDAAIESLMVPSSVKTIGNYAFERNPFKKVSFAAGVSELESINYEAFYGCTNLEQVELPEVAAAITIGDSIFSGCRALKKVDMGKTMVTSIGSNAFYQCEQLEELILYQPSGEETEAFNLSIGNHAFTHAGVRPDSFILRIPSNARGIESGTFEEDCGLTGVIWEDDAYGEEGTTSVIGENLFADCTRLSKIVLKRTDHTEEDAPGIVQKNFCPAGTTVYADGATYELLKKYEFTNAVNAETAAEEGKTAVNTYKGLDAALYDTAVLQAFMDGSMAEAQAVLDGLTGKDVFEQAGILGDVVEALKKAYFGKGGLAESAAKTVAALTEGLSQSAYTPESWKALTDAQEAVAVFMSDKAAVATAADVSTFEGLVRAAAAAKDALQAPQETEAPEETEAPGETEKPGVTDAPGTTDAPEVTQAPGGNQPAPSPTIVPPSNTETPVTVSVKKVTGVKVKAKKKAMTVKWKKLSGVEGYQITYGTKKNFKGAKKVAIAKNATSSTIKKLKRKKVYYVKVRAYIVSSGKKTYGKWSAVKKVKIK